MGPEVESSYCLHRLFTNHEIRWSQNSPTTVLTDVNIIRGNIGRTLRTGHDIERVYWNRDRLYPVYIRQHVDTLKQAVRKWIDETS